MTTEQISAIIEKSEALVQQKEKLASENELFASAKESLAVENQVLQSLVKEQKEQLEWLKRQVFGQKSERLVDLGANTPDFDAFKEALAALEAGEQKLEVEVPKHTRIKKKSKKGNCTLELPDNLPVVEVLNDLSEDEKVDPISGIRMVQIGEDRVRKLAKKPQSFYVKEIVTPKYAVPNKPQEGVIQMPAPPSVIPGSKFDNSVMAHVVVQKMCFHMPLNRIAEEFTHHDIKVTRQMLSQLFINLGKAVLPIYFLIIETLKKSGVLYTDDTPVDLLVKGKGKTQQSRIWGYVEGDPNAPPYMAYEFSETRQYKHPFKFFEDFEGIFHADAYGAYEQLDNDASNDITWCACWAHARRYFENASSGDPEFRRWVLRHMKYLFMFERIAWMRDESDRLHIREKYEKPIVEKLFEKMLEKRHGGKILPKSKLTEAMDYMLKRKQNFCNYLEYAYARMDNNTAERAVRKLVIGRKNWATQLHHHQALPVCR